MKVRDLSGTSFDAGATCDALLFVHEHRTRFLAHRQSLGGAGRDAWIIFALNTEMRHLSAWNKHKNTYSRRLRPDFLLVEK